MSSDLKKKSVEIGDYLYEAYLEEGGDSYDGCGQLLMEWAKERFYGLIAEQHLPHMRELWKKLTDDGHTNYDDGLSYGDLDQTVWAESLEGKFSITSKLIIVVNHCTCADDNTTVYRLDEYIPTDEVKALMSEHEIELDKMMLNFHVCTAWPEEKRKGSTWGDHRDIIRPSLQTLRDHDFKFGYQDGRDKNHMLNFSFGHQGPKVENPHWDENRVQSGLRDLKYHNLGFYVDDDE